MEPVHGVGADALEDVAKVGEGIDLESFAGGDEAGEDGSGPSSVIASEKELVLPSDSDSPQAATKSPPPPPNASPTGGPGTTEVSHDSAAVPHTVVKHGPDGG